MTLAVGLTGARFYQSNQNDDSKLDKCKSGVCQCPASTDRCGSSAFLEVSPER